MIIAFIERRILMKGYLVIAGCVLAIAAFILVLWAIGNFG